MLNMASSPTSVSVDPVLDRLQRIREICKLQGGPVSPVRPPRPASLPDGIAEAAAQLIGLDSGKPLSIAAKNFNYSARFAEIRDHIPGCGYEAEAQSMVVTLEGTHALQLLPEEHLPVLAAVTQGYCNLVIRNKSFLDTADSIDIVMTSLKSKLAAAEAAVDGLKKEKNNLLDEYTALGALHQKVKVDALDVEGRLNMNIGDLTQQLNRAREENESLAAAKKKLTNDAADLCALLESREKSDVEGDASEKEEIIRLQRKISDLSEVNEELTAKNSSDAGEIGELREQVLKLSVDNAELLKQYESERSSFDSFRQEVEAAKRAAEEDAKERAQELEAKYSTSAEQAKRNETEVRKLEEECKSLRVEVSSLQEEKDNTVAEYAVLAASIQKDHANSADKEHMLNGKIKELEDTIAKLNNTGDTEAELSRLSREVEEAAAKLATQDAELVTLRGHIVKLEAECTETSGELSEAQLKVKVLKDTLEAESNFAESQYVVERDKVADLTLKLAEVEGESAAALKESEQKASELAKTCQSLQSRLKELSAGANSVALREAYSSLDQTVDLPEVAAWLSKQILEHPDSADNDESGGERGALRTKILEIHTNNENSMKGLRSEIKRLSKSQVGMERGLAEARELQQEYSDLCDVLKAEKSQLLKKIDVLQAKPGRIEDSNESSEVIADVRGQLSSHQGDDDHTLRFSDPILYIEIGNFECRIGVWDRDLSCFVHRLSFPAIVACPRNESMLPEDLVRGASIQSGAMYRSFRESGYFVGDDARYCAFEHPDAALRGNLIIKDALSGDGAIRDAAAFTALFKYCVSKALLLCGGDRAISSFQTVFPYKSTFGETENMILGASFFESEFANVTSVDEHCLSAVCEKAYVIPEPFLTTLSAHIASAIVVDIGSRSTRVVPVYEGVAINLSMRRALIGGEHCTEALEQLLDAKGLSAYSSNLPRRRKQIARELKEKYAFVAKSFDDAVELYGSVSIEAVRVMHDSAVELPEVLSKLLSKGTPDTKAAKDREDIAIKEQVKQQDGTFEEITLDRELFYCTEVLFGSGFAGEAPQSDCEESIITAILAAAESIEDYDMRVEICENIVFTGGSSVLPGLLERIKGSAVLREGMHQSGVTEFTVRLAGNDGTKESAGTTVNSSVFDGAQLRLAALSAKTETMEGGCVTISDYESMGSSCLDNLA